MQLSRMTILISAPVPARTGASLCESLQALACEICSCLCTCNCNHAAGSFSVRDLLFFAYATFSHATFSHGSISAPVPARTGASLCEIVRLLALACEIRSWLCKCNCNHAAALSLCEICSSSHMQLFRMALSLRDPAPAGTGSSLCEIVRLLALACEICSCLCT